MTDTVSRAVRSRIMASIRSVSRLEQSPAARRLAERRAGCRLRRGRSGLPGKPDWWNKSKKTVVFTNGCFWHRCPRHYREPRSNVTFWREKVRRNRARDRRVLRAYRRIGWRAVVLWEHELRRQKGSAAITLTES